MICWHCQQQSCCLATCLNRAGRGLLRARREGIFVKMRAARMHGYHQPLRLEEIEVPRFGPTEVLIKVAAAGMCRSDFQLVDGYFEAEFPLSFPTTPGHEVAGGVHAVGADVPASSGLAEGTPVAAEGLIKHHIIPVDFDDINDNLEALGRGDMVGRAVVVFD